METISVSFDVTSTDYEAPLKLKVACGNVMHDCGIIGQAENITFTAQVAEDSQQHLMFVYSGKQPEHTVVDHSTGNIIKDASLKIENLRVNDIDLGHIIYKNTVYLHNNNGSTAMIEDGFYGTMGCNGTLVFKFYTPFFAWFLEHS
jgi:hypothetical protein